MEFVTFLAANEAVTFTEIMGMAIRDFLILTRIHDERIQQRKRELEKTKKT